MEMRLQRFLAQAGVASRRKAETLITQGKVRVNGRVVAELGSKVDPSRDKILVDGRRVIQAEPVYLVLCKPKGYVTTLSDPEGRPTVMELIGQRGKGLFPVGRLDFHTDGVLLLTNDGDLAHALMHPSGGVPKVYHAKLHGELSPTVIERLRKGVKLDDGDVTRPAEVNVLTTTGKHTWVEIIIKQGLNRQIHRMAEAVGHAVLKLSRVGYGPISAEGMKPGDLRALTSDELTKLRTLVRGNVQKSKALPVRPLPARSPPSPRTSPPARPSSAKPQSPVHGRRR